MVVAREKHITGSGRERKLELLRTANPNWQDLSEELV